jgi:preprotein translocase subunit SecG
MNLLNPNGNDFSYSDIPQNGKKDIKKILVITIPIFIVLALAIAGLIFYSKSSSINFLSRFGGKKSTSSAALNIGAEDEVEKITKEVKKIMLLPDETPILATVTDLEKVKNQNFFAKAAMGDKVLIFMNAKKAILYRPSDKLIIEVGVVNDQTGGQVAGDNISVDGPTPIPETTGFLPKTTPTNTPLPTATPQLLPTDAFSSEY